MNSPAASFAIGSITIYQRFISPRKGFHCAHHARAGGMTCSNFGKVALARHGFLAGVKLIRARLVACAQFAEEIDHESTKLSGKMTTLDKLACADLGCSGCAILALLPT